jgi:hypothetical protein
VERKLAIARLHELRDAAKVFNNQSNPDQEFYHWRENVLTALEDVFGRNSPEYGEFDEVRFEFFPADVVPVEEFMQLSVTASPVMRLDSSHYFHERLYQADEILLGLLTLLKRESK